MTNSPSGYMVDWRPCDCGGYGFADGGAGPFCDCPAGQFRREMLKPPVARVVAPASTDWDRLRRRFWSVLMVVSVLGLMLFAAGGEGACGRLDTCLEDE